MIAALALALFVADDWKLISRDDGVTVERREVAGSDYGEVRVRVSCKLAPEHLFETIWKHKEYLQFMPHLKGITVLREDGDLKWVYQQVKVPLVSDRDYTLKIRRQIDAESHVYQSFFETDHSAGPPKSADFERVKLIRGSWTVEPGETGGSDLTYRVFSDPGSSLPSFIVQTAQKNASAEVVQAMLKRALATH